MTLQATPVQICTCLIAQQLYRPSCLSIFIFLDFFYVCPSQLTTQVHIQTHQSVYELTNPHMNSQKL